MSSGGNSRLGRAQEAILEIETNESIQQDSPSVSSYGATFSQVSEVRNTLPVFNGIIGALLGSIPGVLLWIILGQIGYIAGIAGWMMIIGARFGYRKFAGGIDKLGSVLSFIIALIMPIISEYLGLAVTVYRTFHEEYALTVGDAFRSLPYFLEESEVMGSIAGSLAIGYILLFIVFFTTKANNRKAKQQLPDLTRK